MWGPRLSYKTCDSIMAINRTCLSIVALVLAWGSVVPAQVRRAFACCVITQTPNLKQISITSGGCFLHRDEADTVLP